MYSFSVGGRFCTDCDFSSVTSTSLNRQKSKLHHHDPKTQRQPLTGDQTLKTGQFLLEVESDENFHEILGAMCDLSFFTLTVKGEVIESWSSPVDGVSTSWCNKESSAASMAKSVKRRKLGKMMLAQFAELVQMARQSMKIGVDCRCGGCIYCMIFYSFLFRSAVETAIAVVVSTTKDVYQASALLNLPPTCFIRYGPIEFKLAPMDSSRAVSTD